MYFSRVRNQIRWTTEKIRNVCLKILTISYRCCLLLLVQGNVFFMLLLRNGISIQRVSVVMTTSLSTNQQLGCIIIFFIIPFLDPTRRLVSVYLSCHHSSSLYLLPPPLFVGS
ncbi:MAG: hypothetical protein J3R72DRAFT_432783 [Linnemannia gamsii]|nr:MAG: hypothetical protein J3R72DRAFT_432783 [Linnemannia gamsii]